MEVEPMHEMMERTLLLNTFEESRDAQLVKDAREGSRASFDVLFQRHKQFVYNVCYRMLGSGDDAVDATQAVFIQAYRAIRKFRGDAAFRSWLYRIAVNECAGMIRCEQSRRRLIQKLEPATQETSGDAVWDTMLELPPDFRAVLVLFYFQGLSCEEIAEVLKCSQSAVRTRLHRARVAFKRKYEEICSEV